MMEMDSNVRIHPEGTEKKSIVQSVERAIMILKCFENHRELRITDISRMLSLHKSTTFGLVSTLEANRFLEQNQETGKYRLGIELFRLGANVDINLRGIVGPYLNNLMTYCQETVNLVVPDGDSVLYIEKIESPHSMRICTERGQQKPMYCTAAGKAILAAMPPEEAEYILNRTEFKRYTEKTIKSVDEAKRQLDQIRRCGYAEDLEELEYGLTCIGVAVLGTNGRPVGAISVSGPSSRMNEELCGRARGLLTEYAAQIQKKL